jgi:DNA mismatch endonuclease (patch repair protein)
MPPIRRTADVVFPRRKVAVFLDGCFWHGCPEHYKAPKTNAAFWRDKVEYNMSRDRSVDELLRQTGWEVIRVWEHESPSAAAVRIEKAVRSR